MVLTDREFALILTAAVVLVVGGMWVAVIPALHELRQAARKLISRTDLLEDHVRETTPWVLPENKKKDS